MIILLQATNEVITRVPCATDSEMNSAVAAAERAFKSWKDTSILTRQQVMFRLQDLIRKNSVTNFYLSIY